MSSKEASDKVADLVIGGIYQHYKGQTYRVHGLVIHSETLEELVHYEALYENELGPTWVRPKAIFLETIRTKEGSLQPRFSLISDR